MIMSKEIKSNGFIANWEKIINSQCREDAERDNKSKAKIIADDYRKYHKAYNAKGEAVSIDTAERPKLIGLDFEDEFNKMFK
jgi:hypothetical protein